MPVQPGGRPGRQPRRLDRLALARSGLQPEAVVELGRLNPRLIIARIEQPLLQGAAAVRLAVDQEDLAADRGAGLNPRQQVRAVGVAGVNVQAADRGVHADFLALDPDPRLALLQEAAERADRLVADQQDGGGLLPEQTFRWWRTRPASHMPLAAMMMCQPLSCSSASLSSTDSVVWNRLEPRMLAKGLAPSALRPRRKKTSEARTAKGESRKIWAGGAAPLCISSIRSAMSSWVRSTAKAGISSGPPASCAALTSAPRSLRRSSPDSLGRSALP